MGNLLAKKITGNKISDRLKSAGSIISEELGEMSNNLQKTAKGIKDEF